MLINIHVIPRAGRALIKEDGDRLKAYLTKPAQDGMANKQLIDLLSGYLKVEKYQLKIIKGENSRNKLISISNT